MPIQKRHTYLGDQGEFKSSRKHTSFILGRLIAAVSSLLSLLSKRDGEEKVLKDYQEVIELTQFHLVLQKKLEIYLSIVIVMIQKMKKNYKMITNNDLEIGKEYTCIKGKCEDIDFNGNVRYYINTAQVESSENGKNELVKYGGGKCVFVNVEDDTKTYEYAVSTSLEDAIISCNSESGCQVVAVTAAFGLPTCKSKDQSRIKVNHVYMS